MRKVILFLFVSAVLPSYGFLTNSFLHTPHNSAIHGSYDPYENSGSDGGSSERNKARMDIRNFLTQRSIQSFVFLLNQCREEYTVRWFEHTLEFKNIDGFHGTGALNYTLFPEWDSLFMNLASRDPEEVVFEVKQKPQKQRRGWSHQNNYVDGIGPSSPPGEDSSKPSSYKPTGSLGNKASPTRRRGGVTGSYLDSLNNSPPAQNDKRDATNKQTDEQKTSSFAASWKANSSAADQKRQGQNRPAGPGIGIHGSYLSTLGQQASESDDNDESTDKEEEEADDKRNDDEEPIYVEHTIEIDPSSLVARIVAVREQISKEWKEDLDTLVLTNERVLEEYEETQPDAEVEDEERGQDQKTFTYDHSAMDLLANSISSTGRASTPFRRANFDLLLMLSTQEGLHRVLSQYSEDSDDIHRVARHSMLDNFYKKNVHEFFDGHQHTFGRADRFLEALLLEPPVARDGKDGSLCLIHPASLVEDIIRERSAVAREWKSIIATIPDEHLDLRRIFFTRQLMELTEWNVDPTGAKTGDVTSFEQLFGPGIFE